MTPTQIKLLKGAGIAVGGALLTYLSGAITTLNFGQYTPIIVAAFSILINAGLKYIDSQKNQPPVDMHSLYNEATDSTLDK